MALSQDQVEDRIARARERACDLKGEDRQAWHVRTQHFQTGEWAEMYYMAGAGGKGTYTIWARNFVPHPYPARGYEYIPGSGVQVECNCEAGATRNPCKHAAYVALSIERRSMTQARVTERMQAVLDQLKDGRLGSAPEVSTDGARQAMQNGRNGDDTKPETECAKGVQLVDLFP